MDGWLGACVDGWVETVGGEMSGWVSAWVDGWVYAGWVGGWVGGWVAAWTGESRITVTTKSINGYS